LQGIANSNSLDPDTLSTNNPVSPSDIASGSKGKEKTIGQYILGKSIGEGTFGKVKLGTHILTSEKVTFMQSH
jgi:serine/threonine protein kinase